MQIQRFPATDRTTINWASGTSTEILIYPATGNFTTRDFQFRISTATVEADESTFNFFEGITRHLMILSGQLELIHEGRYSKVLQAYDQDTFSGEWPTRSRGRVTDFNLMLKSGATGSLQHHHLAQDQAVSFIATTDFYFLYVASGAAIFNDHQPAASGDLLWVPRNVPCALTASKDCDLIEIAVAIDA